MENLLQQGITAAKSGEKARAYQLLTRATQDRAIAEQAWLWLSGIVETDSERLFCLDNVLRINPNNGSAQRGATMLRQKGLFPSAPMPPIVGAAAPSSSGDKFASQPLAQPQRADLQSSQPKSSSLNPGEGMNRQEMAALYKFTAVELANKKLPQVVVKQLTERGVSPQVAIKIVGETQQAFKKARGQKYRKRMMRGLLWTIVGIVLTCGTYFFASAQGGKYILFYGAIIVGVIDFLAGLVGWVSSK